MNKDLVKQVIVVRKDLRMPPGKLAAQVAHASMSFLTSALRSGVISEPWDRYQTNPWKPYSTLPDPDTVRRSIDVDTELRHWIDGSFTKVVVSVPDEQTLIAVYHAAKLYECRHSLIMDEGRTVFNGVNTYTCVAVGPNYIEKVDSVTKALPLYR